MSKKKTKIKKSESKPKLKSEAPDQDKGIERSMLISITRLLKGAGSGVKALKSDSDIVLQNKVGDALQQLPSGDAAKRLEAIDPGKLVKDLKKSCIGIFIDLRDVSCVLCADVEDCAAKFIDNARTGFASVKGAESSPPPDKVPAKRVIVPVTKYDAKRQVFVLDVSNPNPEGNDFHHTIQRVLDEQPTCFRQLRRIVEADFDLEGDGDFMKFVTTLRDPDEGVIRLDCDLSDDNKAALREAGYSV